MRSTSARRLMLLGFALFAAATAAAASAADVPIADFARHEKFGDAKISPDGRHLAVTGIVDDRTMLSLIRLDDMKAVTISPRSREDVAHFWWVAPDRVMYTIAVHFGSIANPSGTGELFTVKADGSDQNIIYGLRVSNAVAGSRLDSRVVSERGTGVLVSALRDDPEHAIIATYPWSKNQGLNDVFPAAFKIELATGIKTPLLSSPLRGAEFIADHHGVVRFAYGDTTPGGAGEQVRYRKDAGSTWEPIVDGEGKGAGFTPIMFDRSGTMVYAHCRGNDGVGGICRWNTETRKLDVLWSGRDSSLAVLVETFDGLDAFAIRTSAGGRPATVLLDKAAPEAALLVSLMKQFPGVDVRITSASTDGRKIVFLAHGDDDPGVYYLHDVESKKTTKLLERRPWIKPQRMAQMQPVALKARDGLALNGYLSRPPGKEEAKNLPLVVMVHGGPFGIFDNWDFDPEVQLLATRGYAVLQINYRGSGGYGSAFVEAGYRDWGGKMQDDVTDATRWAVTQGIADPQRICIFGGSYGGYAALEGAAKEPDLYRCAIGYVGVYDLRSWVGATDIAKSRSGSGAIDEHVGHDENDLWARSPLAHADRIKAKVMLVVGGADERVPKDQGENMRAALAKAHNEPEWLYERTEGHGFYEEGHVTEFYERLLAFLDQQIGAQSDVAASARRGK